MFTPSPPNSSTRSAATETMSSKLRGGRPRPRSGGDVARALHQAGLPGAGAASWGRRAGPAIKADRIAGFRLGLDVVHLRLHCSPNSERRRGQAGPAPRTSPKGRTLMHLAALLIGLIACV